MCRGKAVRIHKARELFVKSGVAIESGDTFNQGDHFMIIELRGLEDGILHSCCRESLLDALV